MAICVRLGQELKTEALVVYKKPSRNKETTHEIEFVRGLGTRMAKEDGRPVKVAPPTLEKRIKELHLYKKLAENRSNWGKIDAVEVIEEVDKLISKLELKLREERRVPKAAPVVHAS